MNRTRAVLTALVLSAGLVLAGCSSDDPAPQHDPSPTTSTSPVESTPTGPVEPTMPAEAMGTSKKAAEAFVKFYWEMVNYAQQTGDLSGLERIADDECIACSAGTDYLAKVFKANGEIQGGVNETIRFNTLGFTKHEGVYTDAHIEFTLKSSQQVVHYPTGKDQTLRGQTIPMQAVVRMQKPGWLMIGWDSR